MMKISIEYPYYAGLSDLISLGQRLEARQYILINTAALGLPSK